jgi:Transglutaminase-like superfamily
MLRRQFIQGALITAMAVRIGESIATVKPDQSVLPTAENLHSTTLIEVAHPRIISLAKEITLGAENSRAAAVRVHDWVRDRVSFGIPPAFYETSATESLDVRVGYCNTKVTLFNALLRASSIPTRIRFFDLSAQVLHGLFDPGTPYVDHAITEVFLDGRWIQIDSYVVDKPLVVAAAKKLKATGRTAGFGIHLNGTSEWDGRSDSLIQCLDNGAIPNYVLKNHGVFVDVADFYERTKEPRNRKTILSGLGIRVASGSINRQIQKIRSEALPS